MTERFKHGMADTVKGVCPVIHGDGFDRRFDSAIGLENTTFIFGERAIRGEALAELLGLTGQTHANDNAPSRASAAG